MYTVLHTLKCPRTPGTRILATWQPLPQPFKLLWGYVETVLHNHQNVGNFDQLKKKIIKAWKVIP